MSEVRRPTLAERLTTAAQLAATVLGAAPYLMALAEYHNWWVVVAATPFALLISTLFCAFAWMSTEVWLLCIILGIMAVGCVVTALTQSGRTGTLLIGGAFTLIVLMPPPQSAH
jgi:hypothetical protein